MRGSLPDLNRIVSALQSHGQGMADEMALRLQVEAPVGKSETAGQFRDSIRGEAEPSGSGIALRVYSDDPLVAVIVEPTAAHEIHTDKPHGLGPFEYNGRFGFHGHDVHHPGTVGWGATVEGLMESLATIVDDELPIILDEAML